MNLIAVALFLTSATFAQNTGKLNLTKGKAYVVTSKITTHGITSVQGQDMESNSDITSTYKLTVDDASADKNKVTGTLTSIKLNMTQMGQEMSYDSEAPDASSPLAAGMDEILNKSQSVTLNGSGELIEDSKSAEEVSPIIKQMENSGFGTQLAFIPVPPKVKSGDTFTVDKNDTTSGTKSSTKYTVKSISSDIAALSFKGTVSTDTKFENQGMEITSKTEGTSDGEAMVNVKTGVVQSAKTTGKSSGTVSAMGMDMPMTVDVTSDVTVTEAK